MRKHSKGSSWWKKFRFLKNMVKIVPQVQAVGRSRVPREGPSASIPLGQRIKPKSGRVRSAPGSQVSALGFGQMLVRT